MTGWEPFSTTREATESGNKGQKMPVPEQPGIAADSPAGALEAPRVRHVVQWDERKIADFWRVVADVNSGQFFSRRAGEVFLRIAGKQLGHRVLDVGCGHGVLVHALRERGYDAVGTDPAPPDDPHLFKLKATELDALGLSRFDSVVSLETFEHLLPAELPFALSSIARVLKPAGKLVFTVPFEEDLQYETCVCPDCHAVFHRWQHQQSFSKQSLEKLLMDAGFRPISFRGFEMPFALPLLPAVLHPAFSRFWSWLRRRSRRNSGVLVVAERRAGS